MGEGGWRIPEHPSILPSCPCRSPGRKRLTMGSTTASDWCITMVSGDPCPAWPCP